MKRATLRRQAKAPPSMARRFIKTRLERGDSARAIRITFNALVDLSPKEIEQTWGIPRRGGGPRRTALVKLSGHASITAKEIHKIQSALGRKARKARHEVRFEFKVRRMADEAQNEALGIHEPLIDYQRAHDAGVMYRATNDERYREEFEEGSP